MIGRRAVVAALSASTIAAAACGQPPDARPGAGVVERARVAMGSQLRLMAWTGDQRAASAAFDEAFAEFERLESLFSVWRDGSDVQRMNAAAGSRPIVVGDDTLEVLSLARTIGDWTGGKFDITFGVLTGLWKFDHDQDERVPPAAAVQARLPLVDYQAISIDAHRRTASVTRAGMRVHLGGIGKGYAVDRAAALLQRRGIHHFMIQAGGDMYVAGRRGDRPWHVGIQDPRGAPDALFAAIDLSGAAVSTSGDYERFFIAGGRRYHHILDPDRGEPANGCRSVTIVAGRSVLADALATGVFVMGPEAGMALIERVPEVEGIIVTAANDVLVSRGLRDRVAIVAPPTDGRP